MSPQEEAAALAKLVKQLGALPPESQRRILAYIAAVFGLDQRGLSNGK